MRFKKAQAAMEFLMTYGWAILIVLVVIAALAYLGVLNPQSLVPEKCTFGTLNCLGAATTTAGNISIILTNTLSTNIVLKNLTITSVGSNVFGTTSNVVNHTFKEMCSRGGTKVNGIKVSSCDNGLTIGPGDQVSIETPGKIQSGFEGTKARFKIKIIYDEASTGLTRVSEGEIVARVNGP